MITMRTCILAGILTVAILPGRPCAADGEPTPEKVSYANPPARLIWLEGENCLDHNWTPGPQRHCWVFDYLPVHGGVLDLASWRLSDEGQYRAAFRFELPAKGEYVLYFLGRMAGYVASPITWQIDDGPEHRQPTQGQKPNVNTLAILMNWKLALTRLGTFEADSGQHTVTIRVREPAKDRLLYFSQQIDALLIADTAAPLVGAAPPARRAPRDAPQDSNDQWVWNRAGASADTGAPAGMADDPAQSSVTISAGALQAALSPVHGGIRKLAYASDTGGGILASPAAAPLITVEYVSGRKFSAARPGRWESTPKGLLYRQQGERFDAAITFTPVPQEAEIRITGTITNRSDEPICGVALAPLAGIGLNGTVQDDTFLVGHKRYGPDRLAGRHQLISPQFTHDWVCVTDDGMTFHIRWEDKSVLDTRATFGRGDGGAALRLEKFPRIKPQQTWQLPPLVLGADLTGQWHRAADRFSSWWHSWAKRPYIPRWLQEAGGLTVGYSVLSDGAIEQNRKALRELEATSGLVWGHTADWLPYGTEAWFPLGYRLTPAQLRKFRQVTDALHRDGGRISIYTNPLMFSRVIPEYETHGRRLATVARDGFIHLTEHTHRHHPMALPYPGREWARRYVDAVEGAVVLGRLDLLYLDQLGAVPAHLDFAPDRHGHEHYGEWVAGSARFTELVNERLISQRPELATMIECPSPAIQQYAALALLVYGDHSVLRYTFPYYYNCVGVYADNVEPDRGLAFAVKAFLTGQPVLLFRSTINKMDESTQRRLRDIVLFKRKIDPVLYTARFRDTVGISTGRKVEARTFVTSKGGVMVAYYRDQAGEAAIEVDLAALGASRPKSCRLIAPNTPSTPKGLSGEDIPFESPSAGGVKLAVPEADFGIIYLDPQPPEKVHPATPGRSKTEQ